MIELIARTSLILIAAWVVSRCLGRATAATRHRWWQCAIVAVLTAPAASALFPAITLPVRTPLAAALPLAAQTNNPPFQSNATSDPLSAAVIVWGSGSTLVALWFVAAHVAAALQRRRGRAASPALCLAAGELGRALGIRRPVEVVMVDNAGPATSGVFHPAIVLPPAAESWTAERIRLVLLHELAHVRRRDCLTQALAQSACALYWFNPLVWSAARALRRERELACDDHVLAVGAHASTYAANLLEIAQSVGVRTASAATLAIARRSDLEHRLRAILASDRQRVPGRATGYVVYASVALMALVATTGQLAASQVPPSMAGTFPQVAMAADDREKATLRLALESSPDVIPALISSLSDADAQVREKAALGLAWRDDARVVDPLIAALHDADSQVREKAAIALGSSGELRARDALRGALADPDQQVREKAAAGLLLTTIDTDPGRTGARVRDNVRGIVNALLSLSQ